MEAVILPKDQFQELIYTVNQIHAQIEKLHKNPDDVFLDNKELMAFLHISKRTAQTWRDERKIPFIQIGSKIFYRLSDVLKFVENNSFKPDGKPLPKSRS